MKTFLISLFLLTVTAGHAQQNSAGANSDITAGYTYDYDKVQALLLERIEKPSVSNAAAQKLLDVKDFPEYRKIITSDRNAFILSLRKWMDAHPALIIETFIHDPAIVKPFAK